MNCKRCSTEFAPVRVAQVYCSRRCRVADAVGRHRSDYRTPTLTADAEKRLQGSSDSPAGWSDGSTVVWPTTYDLPAGPTPGALQGDHYPLEYCEDGFPKLPACLDRRPGAIEREPLRAEPNHRPAGTSAADGCNDNGASICTVPRAA